ncbi:hypothetical protein M431DRAFT_286394 [Trichoderma harzianum CBS 226.95]|uniref:Uncharacterized protein n=1 Tax=Trichoderma harzianum CBS 226.95 TaxID=983964 RepID=A0A2T4ANZ8_TRIHA|nr:hypothetical protein M431DRAFT_286394 [Trichoderma harzianum CBS 226.95]PTB58802.1 hypothetical protein M431DRAFT_286394 [Trichoderma harzianum CBS 226.95]
MAYLHLPFSASGCNWSRRETVVTILFFYISWFRVYLLLSFLLPRTKISKHQVQDFGISRMSSHTKHTHAHYSSTPTEPPPPIPEKAWLPCQPTAEHPSQQTLNICLLTHVVPTNINLLAQ